MNIPPRRMGICLFCCLYFQLFRTMKWYHYISCFLAGLFMANAIPHLIHGISGEEFPTPFASPPGKGLSSSLVNVLWALFNIIVGYLLFRDGQIRRKKKMAILLFFAGIATTSILLSQVFMSRTIM